MYNMMRATWLSSVWIGPPTHHPYRNMIYGKTRELPAYKRVFTERLSRAAKLRHIIKINTASRLSGALGESGYGKPNTETARGSTLQDFHGNVYGAICYLYGSHVTPQL